jgi:hypothetical protein
MPDYLFKDHKPSAKRGEARLRGLYRIISSKTIISVSSLPEPDVSCDTADVNNGQCI